MRQEHLEWLDANLYVLGNVRMTPEQASVVFSIYRDITGQNTPQTSCGRCVLNIKKRIKVEYDKNRS